MNRIRSLIVAGVILTAASTAQLMFAQDQDAGSQMTNLRSASPDQVVDMLAAKLNLSDDQKSQIKPIIVERRQKIADLKSDTSMRRRQKMRKMKSVFEESDKKIEAILNDQQKQQYIQIEQEMRQKMRQRMQNGGATNEDDSR